MMGLSCMTSFSSNSFLVDEPHWELSYINRVILIVLLLSVLVYYIQLILLQHCLLLVALRSSSSSLNWSESPTNLCSSIWASGSSRRNHAHLLWSGLLLCLHFYTHLIRPICTKAYTSVAWAICCWWEESFSVTSFVVCSIVKSSLGSSSLWVNSRCGGSCDASGVGCVRVLSLDWLHNGVIKVND